jgi:16S rRNA (uracil1498-N3)-methyltransferase
MTIRKNSTDQSKNITFLLPILKRDDFEQALYGLTEIGVSAIQLVTTQKTRNNVHNEKDMERAQRIIIAAAEQSKNFTYPQLYKPIPLCDAVLLDKTAQKIFFDYQGNTLPELLSNHKMGAAENFVLLIGPEGDLIKEEKQLVAQAGFIFCVLTPTVLRSVQAASLGAGLIRSLFR